MKAQKKKCGTRIAALSAAFSLSNAALAATQVLLDPLQLEATIGWDDNLTHGSEAPSRLGDRIHGVSVSRHASIPLAEHLQGVFDGFVSAETLARYRGLDRISGGMTGQLQYRGSAGFSAPTFGLIASLQRDQYRSSQRSGTRVALGASARQSWTDRIDAFAALGWSRRDAADAVFDQRERAVRAHVDYSVGRLGAIYAGAERRSGDIVTTSFGYETEYADASRATAPDDAFGAGFRAYRLGGRTTIWSLGWSLPLNARQALDFSWRQARSSAGLPTETVHYRSTLYSLSYLIRY